MSTYTPKAGFFIFLIFTGFMVLSLPVAGQTISGIVFRDFNSDGIYTGSPATGTYSYGEPGVGGITITAYNAAGAVAATTVSSTLTASLGAYTLSVGSTGAYRVEFTNLAASDYEAFRGVTSSGNATSIQFVTAPATTINFGVNYPTDYCQALPPLAVPCYVSGDPLLANATIGDDHVLVRVPYAANGTSVSATPLADAKEIGSVWGIAFQRETKKLFTAAFLKRHVGLGPAGLGGIYVTSMSGTPTSSIYVDLENAPFNLNLGASLLAGRTLPGNGTTSSTDPLALSAVGAVGLGGLAMSMDGKVLYAIDLYNRQLLALTIGNPASASLNAANLTKITIPDPGCTAGVARPFAITVDHKKVYIGVVCTGEKGGNPDNLYAHIYAMDEGATTIPATPVFSFRLNYKKGAIHTGDDALGDNWETWITQFSQLHQGGTVTGGAVRTARAQPMLTDITFADNGDMILAFTDRGGHQLGYRQRNTTDNGANPTLYNGYIGGDLLRAHYDGSNWVLEKNGTVGSLTSAGANNGQGPGTPTSTSYTTPAGEFYYQELYSTIHTETIMGSGVSIPGYNQTIVTLMDPIDVYTGGFGWFNNRTGASDKRAQLYDSGSDGGVTYGKANGLGTIKALCDAAPIQIGNRVWLDANNNGIQDAGEASLANVPITLKGPGLPAAGVTVSTNSSGEYYFSSAVSTTTVSGFVFSLTGLTPGGSYTLSFPTSITSGNAALSSKPNAVTGTNADNIDTDPNLAGIISFTLGTSGQNNFSYDAAYVSCVPPSLTAVANSASVCQGTPVNLMAQISPANSYTYVWSAPAGVTLTNGHTATATATGLPTGTTTFTITAGAGSSCSTTATVSVMVGPAPTATLSSATICVGQSATLTASGGTAYRFSTGEAASTKSTAVVSPVSTTAYSVTVTNASGCSNTATTTVTVNQPPALLTKAICNGTDTYSVSFTTTMGATVAASVGTATGNQIADIPSGQTVTITATLAGCSVSAIQNCTTKPASLGDYVWVDADKNGVQGPNETPISGVNVTLYTNGVASATTVSNANGYYSFTSLIPGSSNSYSVGFTTPAGYTATLANQGSDDAKDSDANPTTGRTQSVTLTSGEFNSTLDAGFYLLTPTLSLNKLVDKSKAQLGDSISYTIVLTNTGNTQATNIVVHDSTSTGLAYLVNSANPPTGTTFTAGTPVSIWTIGQLGAGQSLSLTFQARADSSGILFNTATIHGDTARVCTSVPYRVCAGSGYTFQLTAPTGRASYQWYKNNVAIPGSTTNTLEVTAPGTYSLAVDNATGSCPDYSCCPFIVEEDSLPNNVKAKAVPVSCVGITPQANGQIILSDFRPAYTYQYSLGASFNAAASLSGPIQAIPANGVIASNLVNPTVAQSYTVRVYNTAGCYTDMTVLLIPTVCGCPAAVCVPFIIQQTKRDMRFSDGR
jgi:uncharacterized repeat protein (TIGR01451 family)